jgi:hypothetical protein
MSRPIASAGVPIAVLLLLAPIALAVWLFVLWVLVIGSALLVRVVRGPVGQVRLNEGTASTSDVAGCRWRPEAPLSGNVTVHYQLPDSSPRARTSGLNASRGYPICPRTLLRPAMFQSAALRLT